MKTMPRSFFLFTTLAIVSAVFAYPVHAGRYELIKGKGVEVCETYLKNINAFDPPQPMVCEREINPKFTDFKKPEWTKPTDDQIRALEFDMGKLVNRVLNQPEPKSRAEIQLRTEDDLGWPAKRRIAHVDIDNDGILDTVMKQQDGNCLARAFSIDIAVLTQDGEHYDLEKSQYIDAHFSALVGQLNKDPKPWDRRTAVLSQTDINDYMTYDVFLYKNVAYFDLFMVKSNKLHVFVRKQNRTNEVCVYRFDQAQ